MTIARDYLGKEVEIIIDRPFGSKHPERGFIYPVNYGYVPGTKMPDGEELDAYYLGVEKPVEKAEGICIAVVKRTNDNDDKLVVVPAGKNLTDDAIEKAVEFQEKFYKHRLVR